MNVLTLGGEDPRLHAEAVITVGETFHVRLPVTPGAGLSWEVVQQPGGVIVTDTSRDDTTGVQRIGFRAAHPTSGRLRLSYQRCRDQTSRIRDCVIEVRATDA